MSSSGRGDKGNLLLGIKYESAKLGGVDEARLSKIAEGIEEEVGEGWEADEEFIEGRNAVRAEYGLPKLDEAPAGGSSREDRPRRPWYRRLLGG